MPTCPSQIFKHADRTHVFCDRSASVINRNKRLFIATFAILIGSWWNMGWAIGVLNPLGGAMEDLFTNCSSGAFGETEDDFALAWSFTTGLWTIGGAIGAVIGGPASNIRFIGRKRGLLATCILMGLGSYLEAHPFFFFYQNSGYDKNECNGAYDFILAGRFISGWNKTSCA